MAVKRNGLGKGLDSLIPTKAENNIKKLKISLITTITAGVWRQLG